MCCAKLGYTVKLNPVNVDTHLTMTKAQSPMNAAVSKEPAAAATIVQIGPTFAGKLFYV